MSYSGDSNPQVQRQQILTWILLVMVIVFFVIPNLVSWLGILGGTGGRPRAITPRGELADFEKTSIELFQSVSPSVVYLNTRARVASRWGSRTVEVEAGSGSGFLWDELGHVVTNFHVLQNASSAQVVLNDQSTYEASLVGASADHDLAVLRIHAPPSKVRPVLIGESDDLLVGQSVFAIGNPFGLNQTLTTGVVSAMSRTIEGPSGRKISDVIQIDAAINPGNSGGPLLDSAGRLIGVNTAIYSPSGASAGVGFAIPVDTVNRVVPQIIAQGRYEPPRLGIVVNSELSRAVTSRLEVPGVLILEVVEGGSADTAGLRGTSIGESDVAELGDIIQRIGGSEISNMSQLQEALEAHDVGDTVSVECFRDGETRTVQLVLQ